MWRSALRPPVRKLFDFCSPAALGQLFAHAEIAPISALGWSKKERVGRRMAGEENT